MKTRLWIIVSVAGLVLCNPSVAATINNGATAGTFFRDCASTTCETTNQPTTHQTIVNNLSGQTAAVIGDTFQSLGTASVQVGPGPAGDIFAPVAKAKVETVGPIAGAPEGSTISAVGAVIQQFKNESSEAVEYGVRLDADWEITSFVQPSNPNAFNVGLGYALRVFDNPTDSLIVRDQNDTSILGIPGFGTFIDISQITNATQAQGDSLFFTNGLTSVSDSISIDSPLFSLLPGESIFVSVILTASAGQGGKIDAFNTLRTALIDENGKTFGANGPIQAVPSPVPLPAAAWLFISALGGLLCMKRYKKHNSATIKS